MKLTPEQLQERLARNPSLAALNPEIFLRSENVKASMATATGYGAEMQNEAPKGVRQHDGCWRKKGEDTKSDWRNRGVAEGLNIAKVERTKKPLLNKTETLWKGELERRGHKIILVQALTFRLGDRLNYRPDLVTIDLDFKSPMPGAIALTCWETKAPHRFRSAGVTKIKAAAKQYPFIRFVLVMRDKGNWTEREIGSE